VNDGYVLYIGFDHRETQMVGNLAYFSETLHGTYQPLSGLTDGIHFSGQVGSMNSGYFYSTSNQYWTYSIRCCESHEVVVARQTLPVMRINDFNFQSVLDVHSLPGVDVSQLVTHPKIEKIE